MGRLDVSESFAMPAACSGGPSPECTTDAECDDTDPCTVDTCSGGVCSNVDDGSCATGCNGNGVCDSGEDCTDCSSDCAGVLNGKPSARYCCGDGTAQVAEGNGDVCQGNY